MYRELVVKNVSMSFAGKILSWNDTVDKGVDKAVHDSARSRSGANLEPAALDRRTFPTRKSKTRIAARKNIFLAF